jgi:hypothetical protein
MNFISTSTIARNNDINRDDLFLALASDGLIIRDGNHWNLTDLGKNSGGSYKYNEKRERWIVWSEDFDIRPYLDRNINDSTIKILCLSNSFKEGGRCLAGLQIGNENKIRKKNNRPVWVRPVCDTRHEQVPNQLAQNIKYFDVIQFDSSSDWGRDDYQSENLQIKNNRIRVIGRKKLERLLDALTDNYTFNNIFGNTGNSLTPEEIDNIQHSLMMIKLESFEVIKNGRQFRLAFSFKNNNYNLPITDPIFLHSCSHDQGILDNVNKVYIVLSLGVPFNNGHNIRYYKLVATILY